ncbi:MAG: carbon-nitrogen hydrolase family protein [Rhodospirillaceae bacterium]|nr:MAG: carbon-nitrogen hydrolase family protein [Rhodospirillaceae bacterium]
MSTAPFIAACVQVNASEDMKANIDAASALVRRAVEDGAALVLMPENVSMMTWGRQSTLANAMAEPDHVALRAFRALAKDLKIWLHAGSLSVLVGDGKVANRTYVIDPDGNVAAFYDKIHMFDVDLGNGERYAESATFHPGAAAVCVDLPWGRLGLTICYDLRFPHLYRHLAQAGADFIVVPAAFTRLTGEAHWHVLLRARAIETGCFILAPAQTGTHAGGRQTYGHALMVNPWGEVLADAGLTPGMIAEKIDVAEVACARGRVPAVAVEANFSRLPRQTGIARGLEKP